MFSRLVILSIFSFSQILFAQWTKISPTDAGSDAKIHVFNDVLFLYDNDPLRSDDGGLTWEDLGNKFNPGDDIHTIFTHNDSLFASGKSILYISVDDGASWTPRHIFSGTPVLKGFQSDGSVLFLRSAGSIVYRSSDNGHTFEQIIVPLYSGGTLADFAATGNLWVATQVNSSTFISKDAGHNWLGTNASGGTIWKTHVHQGYIFGMTYLGGLHRWDADSEAWVKLTRGLAEDGDKRSWLAMVSAEDRLFVKGKYFLSNGNEYYYSDDLGAHWQVLDLTDLPDVNYDDNELGLNTYHNNLYTVNYKRNDADRTGLFVYEGIATAVFEPINTSNPSAFRLEQNYPNPFNPDTRIKYQVARQSDVKLTVYNLLGQKVRVLVDEKKAAGSYSMSFDASGLSSGVYYYKLSTGYYSETRKMLLTK